MEPHLKKLYVSFELAPSEGVYLDFGKLLSSGASLPLVKLILKLINVRQM